MPNTERVLLSSPAWGGRRWALTVLSASPGLAVDYHNERLYWADAKLSIIGSIRLNGTDPIVAADSKRGQHLTAALASPVLQLRLSPLSPRSHTMLVILLLLSLVPNNLSVPSRPFSTGLPCTSPVGLRPTLTLAHLSIHSFYE